jgi:pilus assembly protein Flp/PilA
MLKFYVKAQEAVQRLRTDKDGVVSFEYVIVAACIVAVVAAVFGGAGGTSIQTKLSDAISAISLAP